MYIYGAKARRDTVELDSRSRAQMSPARPHKKYNMIFAHSVFFLYLSFISVCGQRTQGEFETYPKDYFKYLSHHPSVDDAELVLAFVMFRHGDRTPDPEELDLFPANNYENALFPYGPKALTNKGKQRSYAVGTFLRRRYNGLISGLYLPEEMVLWTTDFDRTKMTALTAMAGLYPPPPAQRWNPSLDWQPVPFNTKPYHEDDLLYWYNCPRYLWLRNQIYKNPEVRTEIMKYKQLFDYLSLQTKAKITTPEDVFYLSNLFQALRNVGKREPKWVHPVIGKINEMTILEYGIELYNSELIRLASGVMMQEILNVTTEFVEGRGDERVLRLYSAHENNVAALMAAVGAFDPHQPPYGATFSLELRRKSTGEYGVAALYAIDPTTEGRLIPMKGCGGELLCDFNQFLNITKENAWSQEDYKRECPKLS